MPTTQFCKNPAGNRRVPAGASEATPECGQREPSRTQSFDFNDLRSQSTLIQALVSMQTSDGMRILTFTSLFPNRTRPEFGIFVYQRVAALARRPGNQVQVIAPVPYFPASLPIQKWRAFSAIPHAEMVGSLPVVHPRYPLLPEIMPLHGFLIFLGSLAEARRLHRQEKFDCIDAHYVYPDGFAAVLLGKALGVPVFLSARGTDINIFPKFRLIRPMIRWALRRAAGIVAVSAALKQIMVDLGVPPEKVEVIANGVDTNRFHAVDREKARRELQIPIDARVVVSVGSLVAAKSHALLISAIARLTQRNHGLRVYIVGEGPLRAKLENLVKELHLEGQVFLPGPQPNDSLKHWFSAADISCLASSREGMPNVVLESLSCGTPVVATRVGGVPEVLVSDDLGILVEANAEAIADGIDRALRRAWEPELIMSHAHSRTWDTVAEDVEAFFEKRLKL